MECNDRLQFSENILKLYNQKKEGNKQYEEHLKYEEERIAKARNIIENLIFPSIEEVINMNHFPVLPKAHFYTSLKCNFFCGYSEIDYWPIKAIVDASFDSAYEYISKERIKTNNYELEKAMELAHEYGLTAIRQTDPMRIGWHHYCFYLSI